MKPILKTYSRQKKHCSLYDTEYKFLKEDVLLCCRGCLATDRRLFNIHDHNLADALAHIAGTPVFKDELPQHLCSYCCSLLLKCESFKDTCLHTQRSLNTELLKGSLNLDRVHEINRPFNHYIDLNVCPVNTVQYIDLNNSPDIVDLDDLNVNLKDETETVKGIGGDNKTELEITVACSIINDDIEEKQEIKFIDIDGIINEDIVDELATVPGIDGYLNYGIEEKLETVVGREDTINDDTEDEAATVPGIDGDTNNGTGEKLETDEDTDSIINDNIGGDLEIRTVGLDGIINKTDSKAEFETQKRLLNISADKLKFIQNRVKKIRSALKRKKENAITVVNDKSYDVRLKAEEKVKRPLKRKQVKIKNTDADDKSKNEDDANVTDKSNDVRLKAEKKIKRPLKRKQEEINITDGDSKSKNDDEPIKFIKVRRRRKIDKRKLRKADDDYMPDFDFAEFETSNDVEIVILAKEEQLAEIEARKVAEGYKNAAYRCELCGKHYRDEDAFNNHVEKHSEKKGPNECPVCKMRFKLRTTYWRHYDNTHRFKFVCKQCGFVSRIRGQARMHHQYHDGKKYECSYCPKVFSKSTTYLSHVRLAHKMLNTVCGMCGETFVNVRQHMAQVHGVARKKTHMECKTCEVTFVNTHALNKHKMAAGEEHTKMHPCVQCGDNFDSVDAMQIHDDKEHPKCEHCNVTFLNASCFDTHVDRKHRGVGNHLTKKKREANKLFKNLGRPLGRPPQAKRGEGPKIAVCDHCGKVFKNPSLLAYHLRKVRGEKLNFACPHCPKSFIARTLYEDHLRVHTGEKPFKCDHCGVAFTLKGNLHRHMLNVHLGIKRKSICDICGRVFSTPSCVKLHVRTVHNGEPGPRRVRKKKLVSESTD